MGTIIAQADTDGNVVGQITKQINRILEVSITSILMQIKFNHMEEVLIHYLAKNSEKPVGSSLMLLT